MILFYSFRCEQRVGFDGHRVLCLVQPLLLVDCSLFGNGNLIKLITDSIEYVA